MLQCFVIQPFDHGVYDARYREVFRPAIVNAGLEPYRVDEDPSVAIPIAEIETGIRDSAICFADITTDNPNVWYELGFAFACRKEVVLVSCSKERNGKFPFDIQHRSVINYASGTKSDFEKLETQITEKLKAYMKTQKVVARISGASIVEQEGMKSHEIAMMLIVLGENIGEYGGLATYRLKQEMNKAGYTDSATGVGLITLQKKGMVITQVEGDFNGNEYAAVSLTQEGQEWIVQNQDLLEFNISKANQQEDVTSLDDLPF